MTLQIKKNKISFMKKENLILTEQTNPDTKDIDLMSSLDIVTAINREDKKVALAIEKVLPQIAKAVDLIANAFFNGGRLAYFGAGTSGRLGVLDASECWPTFGVEHGMVCGYIAGGDGALRYSVENAEDSTELADADLAEFNPKANDVVVAISASGNAAYVIEILKKARQAGVPTVAISSNPTAKMAEFADIFINPVVGQEAITGSSRMKSGTAQKMILNILSTGAMVRIGKTYQNYMIDVRLMNEKLQDRGCRIVSQIADIPYEKAALLLNECGRVKVACVMGYLNCSQEQAEEYLRKAGGILRKIIH